MPASATLFLDKSSVANTSSDFPVGPEEIDAIGAEFFAYLEAPVYNVGEARPVITDELLDRHLRRFPAPAAWFDDNKEGRPY